MPMLNNAKPLHLDEAVQRLREDCPFLLLDDETVGMAFKAMRDEYYFTSHRILILDRQGILGKQIQYDSIPYHSIKAFACETAGSVDFDTSLIIYGGFTREISFSKSAVDILEVMRFMGHCVFPKSLKGRVVEPVPPYDSTTEEAGKTKRILSYLANDNVRVDEKVIQEELMSIGALISNEDVQLAYKCGRDMIICTSFRVIFMDAKGITGKKVEFLNLRYDCIKCWDIETAGGGLDRDATFRLWTNLGLARNQLETEVRKGQSDIMEVMWYFNNKLLGEDTISREQSEQLMPQGPPSSWRWLVNDMSQIDAREVDMTFHSNPPILQRNEVCEVAFKGKRDLVLFTTKRIIYVDVQGFTGKRVNYRSVPYSSVQHFEVTSAGGGFDRDCELGIYLECWFIPSPPGEDPPPPMPGMSYIEFDINRNTTDILGMYRYLAGKVISRRGGADYYFPHGMDPLGLNKASTHYEPSPQGAWETFLNFMGNDLTQTDTAGTQAKLSTGGPCPVLHKDEQVLAAFKVGRDSTIFTSDCILDIDVQGFSGKRMQFKCIPYTSIRSFNVTSSGAFDRDSELGINLKTPWQAQFKRDFRAGNTNILDVQMILADKILTNAPGKPADFLLSNKVMGAPSSMEKLMSVLMDKNMQIDAGMAERTFKDETPFLQPDEKVELAFQSGRDLWLLTDKRVVSVDVRGMTGKKVTFESFPFKFLTAFYVKSRGCWSRSVKTGLKMSACQGFPNPVTSKGMDIKFKKGVDIFQINNSLGNKILKNANYEV